jgi:hypothetical protein
MAATASQIQITRNPFAESLLNYSADRDDCIGRPDRWGTPPPLMVDGTQLHLEMSELADELWAGPSRPVWYFLVGGPGNGKSEAVGALVRQFDDLRKKAGSGPTLEKAVVSGSGRIKYAYHCEPKPGTSLVLIQDISVPKAAGSRPEVDLLQELNQALASGNNAVVCANRGMLLRAVRAARARPEFSHLVSELEKIDKNSQESSTQSVSRWTFKSGSHEADIRVWPLDHESVMLSDGADGWSNPTGSLLDQIVAKATGAANWETGACARCAMRSVCPFLNDALWLRDPARRRGFLRTLRHAEALSGQRIVLREALGMLAMVLVGTPSDFVVGQKGEHPCDWVHKHGAPPPGKEIPPLAGVLELLSHRIYVDTFGRHRPAGLDIETPSLPGGDTWITDALQRSTPEAAAAAASAKALDKHFAKQAGPPRFAASNSVFSLLDPARDCGWCNAGKLDPDSPVEAIAATTVANSSALEAALLTHYEELQAGIKAQPQHADVTRQLAALARWFSGFYLWMAGLATGSSALAPVLDDFLVLLATPDSPLGSTGNAKSLTDLLRDSGREYMLTHGFIADLPQPRPAPTAARLRSPSPRWPANDRLALRLSNSVFVPLSAGTLVDIWQRRYNQVAKWCMPPALENLTSAWRNESMVLEQRYRDVPAVTYKGSPPLEFEARPGNSVQVRRT